MFIRLPKRVPWYVKLLYPSWYVWDKPVGKDEKVLYLTFDDGPVPEVTPFVLDTLSRKRIKATFFCIGENVQRNRQLFKDLLDQGHSVGNHTFNHLKGWKTSRKEYLENTQLSEKAMCRALDTTPEENLKFDLFRPPYGKIKRSQARDLHKLDYKIVMYRTVAYDWKAATPEECFENVTQHAKSGDLIVFHDSVKAFSNLKASLENVIDYYLERGYSFKTL